MPRRVARRALPVLARASMAEAVLGLGSNLGASRTLFRAAEQLLHERPGVRVVARSRLYATPPLGPPQPDYLNGALRVACQGDVEALFAQTQAVERLLGRERRERWGARTIDIDVLHWSGGSVRTPQLEVPHRELEKRNFALAPLLDVAPELSSMCAPVLEALGGAPPQLSSGWLSVERAGEGFASGWLSDDAELIALAIELCGVESSQPADRARPFSVSCRLDTDGDIDALRALLGEAAAAGFAVRGAVVTHRDGQRLEGLLLGAHVHAPCAVNARPLRLERNAHGQRRVRGSGVWSEDGLISRGSVTM
jgi:2-amino-4-hydroxy-6-hydroxymethyldihydropteridine diphosphokinase